MTELLDIKCCNDDIILCGVTMYINIAYFLFVPLLTIHKLNELLCCVSVEYFDIVQLLIPLFRYSTFYKLPLQWQ